MKVANALMHIHVYIPLNVKSLLRDFQSCRKNDRMHDPQWTITSVGQVLGSLFEVIPPCESLLDY